MFLTTYRRDKDSSNVDSALVNAILSNTIFLDSEEPFFEGVTSPPDFSKIMLDESTMGYYLTTGKYTKAFWSLMLKLYFTQADFKIFILSLFKSEDVGKAEGLQLKVWLKQRVIGGFYFPKEVNDLLSANNYEAFRQAKFKLLIIAFKQYLFYRSKGND